MTGTAPEIMEHLRSGSIDIAISLEPENEHQLSFEPVFTDTLSWGNFTTHAVESKPKFEGSRFYGPTICYFQQRILHLSDGVLIFQKAKIYPRPDHIHG